MKVRMAVLALCAASAALRAEGPPDYFADLRDKTFVEVDQSYLVKVNPALPQSPALFRIRHLFLRVKQGIGEAERRWWPMRSLFLIEAASRNRFVAEFTAQTVDVQHPDAPRSWTRLSGSNRGTAVEIWRTPAADELEVLQKSRDDPETGPDTVCGGSRYRILGGDLQIAGVHLEDMRSRTVSVSLAEIRDAAFSADEVRELDRLRSLGIPRLGGGTGNQVDISSGARLAWSFLFMERPGIPPDRQDLVLVPDPGLPGDLALWRSLTYLPQDLPPFPALPPEAHVR